MKELENKEVYICKYGDEIVYIGKGGKDRHRHCVSGVSHVFGLNEIYFTADKENLFVEVIHQNITDKEAVRIERELIAKYKPRFNKYKDGNDYLVDHYKRDRYMTQEVIKLLIANGHKVGNKKYCWYASRIFKTIKHFGWVNLLTGCQANLNNMYDEDIRLTLQSLSIKRDDQNPVFKFIFTFDVMGRKNRWIQFTPEFINLVNQAVEREDTIIYRWRKEK